MSRKYFGTDGVRGKANSGVMTADMVLKIGMAAGNLYRRGNHRHRVVIGKDTRLSGYMIEQALTAGLWQRAWTCSFWVRCPRLPLPC